MISILKSIWNLADHNQQLLGILLLNFIFLATIYSLNYAGMISEMVLSASNIMFWLVLSFIMLFGVPFLKDIDR